MAAGKRVDVRSNAEWIVVHRGTSASRNRYNVEISSVSQQDFQSFSYHFHLTFDDRHRKHIHNQCDEQVHLHLVQCLALHNISERDEPNEPHNTMTRPLEKLALTLKAANCIKVEQGRHKLLR